MKAVMKVAPGVGHVEVRDIPEPAVPAGHVKIAVYAAGICGTDLHIYYDEYRSRPPVVLGHEVAGTVAELGAGVDRVAVGDRVTVETYFSTCGVCRACRAGRVNLCPERRSIGSMVDGGFTSYLVVPAINARRLPAHVSFLAGALTEPLARVVHSALELTRVAPQDLAVVSGPGTIGLLTLQVLRAAGARVVMLGTAADAARLHLARELGAQEVFDVQHDDYAGAIGDLSDGEGADVVLECSGSGAAALGLLPLARRGGHYAQIGLFGKPITWDLDQVVYRELRVSGGFASVPSAWDTALRLLADGVVQTEPLVSHIFPVTEWRAAFDLFADRTGIKTVLRPVE